jgi:hypothetical protein
MQKILLINKDLVVDSVKKLMKTEMNIAKECAALLIPSLIAAHDSLEASLLEIYANLLIGDSPQQKIIAAKYLQVN